MTCCLRAAVLLIAVAVLAGCGGDSDSQTAPSTTDATTTTEGTTTTTVETTTTTEATTTTTAPPTSTTEPRDPGFISAADFDAPWPLTVDSATVRCVSGSAVIAETGGVTYAVNGIARGMADANGWHEIDEIWLDNPDIPGTKVDIGPVIDLGLELC